MGHHIRAIIGKTEILSNIVSDWHTAKQTMLIDGYGFIFLSDTLFDDITAQSNILNTLHHENMIFFTSAIHAFLAQYSQNGKLAYIETDFFGGHGTQAGVLFENMQISIAPTSDITEILHQLGIPYQNPFDAIGLSKHRFL